MALDVLEKYQIENLIDHLKEIYPKELNASIIAQLKKSVLEGNQEVASLTRELNELLKGNRVQLAQFLSKYRVPFIVTKSEAKETETEVKHALDMKEVTDFSKDGKMYIKITYQDGRVQIIENRNHKNTQQIFEDVNKLKALQSMNGTQNAEIIFRELLKDYIEVPLENSTFLNQEKLNLKEQAQLHFVEQSFPNHRVLAAPSANIFIVKGNPDLTVEVVETDGIYQLKQLEEYKYGNEREKKEEGAKQSTFSIPQEMEKNEFSAHSVVTEESEIDKYVLATVGMTEAEIAQYLRLHGKNPQQIMMIMLKLEERKMNQMKQQEAVMEKPKQMVLKKESGMKMAGFVDALTLAFLVGTLSGILFFAMLHLFLKFLY